MIVTVDQQKNNNINKRNQQMASKLAFEFLPTNNKAILAIDEDLNNL